MRIKLLKMWLQLHNLINCSNNMSIFCNLSQFLLNSIINEIKSIKTCNIKISMSKNLRLLKLTIMKSRIKSNKKYGSQRLMICKSCRV